MNNLIQLIREKADKLSNTELNDLDELEFFEEFLKKYNANDFDSYTNVSNLSYLGCLLLATHINLSVDEVKDNLLKIKNIVNNPDLNNTLFDLYFQLLKILNNLNLLDSYPELPKNMSDDSRKKYESFKKVDCEVFTVNDDNEQEYYDLEASKAMVTLFKALPEPNIFMCFAELNLVREHIRKVCNDFIDIVKDSYEDKSVTKIINKKKYKIARKITKEYIECKNFNIFEHYQLIITHYNKLSSKIKELVKRVNRQIRRLEMLEDKITRVSEGSLIKLDKEVDKLLVDSEVEYNYLLFALKHNLGIQVTVEEQNKVYNNNSITKLDIIFNKYGFSFNDIPEEYKNLIVLKDILEVEAIIKTLKYSELTFITEYSDIFAKVIINSNTSLIQFIDAILKRKIISKEFILMNNELLYNSIMFEKFFNNINYLQSLCVDLVNLGKSAPKVLLLDTSELLIHTNILGEYQFSLDSNRLYDFEVLENDDLIDYFDNYIELGLGRLVIDNPKYLNENSPDIIKRVMIANLIGLSPINSSQKLIGVINTGDNFLVDKKDYDNFIIDYKEDYQNPICLDILNRTPRNIISATTKNIAIIKKLDDNFMKDSLTYVINGVIISRKRVMRNLEVLLKNASIINIPTHDLLFQAILYKMINNIEPNILEQIYNIICELDLSYEEAYTYKKTTL